MNPRYYNIKRLGRSVLASGAPPTSGWRRYLFDRFSQLHYPNTTGFFSQSGQDRFLDELIFRGKRGGVFVDIGANDGVNLSNSYFFERERSWTGLCVEPNPSLFKKLAAARKCQLAECCAAAADGEVKFAFYEDERHLYGRAVDANSDAPADGSQQITVKAREINALLRAHGLSHIDYLSIDIEGGELALFRALDLSYFKVKAVSLEENDEAPQMDRVMFDSGYSFRGKIGCDRIYVQRDKPSGQ